MSSATSSAAGRCGSLVSIAATAAKLVTPTARARSAKAMPRAAPSPTRMPVKPPGPTAAATMSSAGGSSPAASMTRSIIGNSTSAWPWRNAWRSATSTTLPRPTAAEQAEPAVSMASRMGLARGSCGAAVPSRLVKGSDGRAWRRLDRAHLDDFGDVMAQHVLDARLQGRGRARTARARALHVEVDDAVFVIVENDVAAIHRHRRSHSGFKQFFDLGDDFVLFLAAVGRARGLAHVAGDDRPPGGEMLHDRGL